MVAVGEREQRTKLVGGSQSMGRGWLAARRAGEGSIRPSVLHDLKIKWRCWQRGSQHVQKLALAAAKSVMNNETRSEDCRTLMR